MTRTGRAGFTLMELVMAMAITGIILLTVMYLSTNAVRYQTESVLKSEAASSALYSLAQMRRELEDATYIQPKPGGCTLSGGCNQIAGCLNWNFVTNSASNPASSTPTTEFDYCLANNQLYRYEHPGCTTTYAPACGSVSSDLKEIVVAQPPGLFHTDYPGAANPIFIKSGDSSIDLHYVIGFPGQGALADPRVPVPADYLFNIRINVNKSYSDTLD